jgi:asparagine synthase (glutamine-hydrolysing)
VIDVEGGDQLIFAEDRSVVVVCNGEVYNYLDLHNELQRRRGTDPMNCDGL